MRPGGRALAIDATGLVARGKGVARLCAQLVAAAAASARPHVAFLDAAAPLPALPSGAALRYRRVRCRPAIGWEQLGLGRALREEGAAGVVTFRERLPAAVARRAALYLFEVPDHRLRIATTGARPLGRAGGQGARGGAPRRGLYARLAEAYGRLAAGPTLRRVAALLASSEHTAGECAMRYGVSAQRVAVVYPGLDPMFAPARVPRDAIAARERFSGGRPYVLHFASGDPRDASLVAISVFARVAAGRPGLDLVLGGDPGWSRAPIEAAARRAGLGGRVRFAGFLTGGDLVSLYRGAVVYLDTSLYEGFGFQPAEAMACGVPVVASAAGSLPEVIGDAGWLAAPGDPEGFAAALARVLDDSAEARAMRERGLERAAELARAGGGSAILERAAAALGFGEGEAVTPVTGTVARAGSR